MNGSGGMDGSVTIDLDSTQTTITALKHNSLVIGEQPE